MIQAAFSRNNIAFHPETGVQVPSGVPRYREGGGIFIEQGTTNWLLESNNFASTAWPVVSGTKTLEPSPFPAPDGSLSAWTLTDPNTFNYNGIGQDHVIPMNAAAYCMTIWVLKTTGATSGTFGINFSFVGGTAVNTFVRLNTDTGQLGGSGAARAAVESRGDWWKITAWFNNNGTNNTLRCQIYAATNIHGVFADSPAGVGSATIWRAQVEAGSLYPTTYIESGAARGVRAAEICNAPLILAAEEFSVECEIDVIPMIARTSVFWRLCNGDAAEDDLILYHPDSFVWRVYWRTGGGIYSNNIDPGLILPGLRRLFVRKRHTDISLWRDSEKIFEAPVSHFPAGFSRVDIGNSAGQYQPNTWLRSLRIYRRALTDEEILGRYRESL